MSRDVACDVQPECPLRPRPRPLSTRRVGARSPPRTPAARPIPGRSSPARGPGPRHSGRIPGAGSPRPSLDEHLLAGVEDACHETVLVAADVEHDAVPD